MQYFGSYVKKMFQQIRKNKLSDASRLGEAKTMDLLLNLVAWRSLALVTRIMCMEWGAWLEA